MKTTTLKVTVPTDELEFLRRTVEKWRTLKTQHASYALLEVEDQLGSYADILVDVASGELIGEDNID